MQRRIPETSIEAYRHALESGLLKRLQFEIIEYYCEHDCDEGVTCLEMLDIIARAKGTNAWKIQQNYQKAISKLKDLGVLEPLEKRPCMASTSGESLTR
jgi:predicted house-cleaning noncanonical NTP pyrophosphatase (MazG superfamily)